jgi:hypothetical protein
MQGTKHGLQSVRRLEEHHGAPLGVEIGQTRGPLAGFPRQESLETEAVGGEP